MKNGSFFTRFVFKFNLIAQTTFNSIWKTFVIKKKKKTRIEFHDYFDYYPAHLYRIDKIKQCTQYEINQRNCLFCVSQSDFCHLFKGRPARPISVGVNTSSRN